MKKMARALLLVPMALLIDAAPAQQPREEAPFGTVSSLPAGRRMHGSVVLGDHLYVIGGHTDAKLPKTQINQGSFTSTVLRAPIAPDGTTGEWIWDRQLPQIRAYISNSTVALNDIVYVVGGTEGLEDLKLPSTKYKTVLSSRPSQDGALGEWVESAPFPGPGISCFTVSATPGFIHLIGGNTEENKATNQVVTGVLAADGNIAKWEYGPDLPKPLWFHHSATAGGRVWVFGGLAGKGSKTAIKEVFSSTILGSGRLAPWVKENSSLLNPIYRGANATAGPYLMAFCVSLPGNKPTNDVVFSYLTPNGLAPWAQLPTALPMRLYTSCAPDYRRGMVFIPGGGTDSGATNITREVVYFRLTQKARQAFNQMMNKDEVASSTEIAPDQSGTGNRLAYTTQQTAAQGGLPGFLPFDTARRRLLSEGNKPLVAYFHMAGSGPSEAQVRQLQADAGLKPLTDRALFAWIDVKEAPQLAQQFGILRAPTWILYDAKGKELGRATRALNSEQIAAGIKGVN